MSGFLLSSELRGFERKFNAIRDATHRDALGVFDDFLTYTISALNPEPNPNPSWTYKKEYNVLFYELMTEWITVTSEQVKKHGWYDAFGEFFMACVGHTSQQYRGQFYTATYLRLDDTDNASRARRKQHGLLWRFREKGCLL